MIILPTPSAAFAEQKLTLGGVDYIFTFRFNNRDKRWRIDISTDDDVVVKNGIKIMENQSLLDQYILDDFNHGDIFCLRNKEDGEPVGRNNLGIGKSYELVYFTNAEIEELSG